MAKPDYTRAGIAASFADFNLRDVRLSSRVLGAGSFGEVVVANWGGTVCAAKRLHKVFSTLLPESTTGSIIKRYLQECKTWSQLRHPGIVLFLGVVFEPGDSNLPLLVMEKMDTSLLHFVESRTKESLPLRHKAYILFQVACAMTYLHGKQLVHRDLTPNNILIDELSIKAKVTDFGLTRVAAESRMATKSAAGTPTFMPPEALSINPRHDSKLDVFSFGNLILFTITHKWPMPDANVAVVNGELKAFTEFERRETYVAIMDRFEKKLLLLLVQESLDNDPDRRPSSPDVLKRMEEILSKIPAVSASAKTSTGIIIEATDSDRAVEAPDSDRAVEAPDSDRAAELSKQLQARNSKLFDYTLEIGKLKEEKSKLNEEKSKLKEEKGKLAERAESLEHQLRQSESALHELRLSANQPTPGEHSPLQSQDPFYTNLLSLNKDSLTASWSPRKSTSPPQNPYPVRLRPQDRVSRTLQELNRSSFQYFFPEIDWSEEVSTLPHPMFMASAAAIGGTVYVGGGYSGAKKPQTDLYKFNLEEKQWVILPPPHHPVSGFALVAQGDKLHLIGGEYARARSVTVSDKVQSLNVSSGITEWSMTLPPLKSPRYSAAAISHEGYIIVAGGIGLEGEPVHTLEIIHLAGGKRKPEWFSVNKMPLRCHVRPQLVVCNKVLYLAGRQEDSNESTHVFSLLFRDLLDASKPKGHYRMRFPSKQEQENATWSQESSVVAGAALFVLGGYMMAAGGAGGNGGYCWSYNTEHKAWLKNCAIPQARKDTAVTIANDNNVILLGGSSQTPAGERKAVSYVNIGMPLQ